MGDGESKGRPHQGPTQELLRSDKAIVNQAAEQTIREGGRREEVGGAREATNLITDGPSDNNLLSSKQSGPAKLLQQSPRKQDSGRERVPVRRQETHL